MCKYCGSRPSVDYIRPIFVSYSGSFKLLGRSVHLIRQSRARRLQVYRFGVVVVDAASRSLLRRFELA